jgi:hypothetical protein
MWSLQTFEGAEEGLLNVVSVHILFCTGTQLQGLNMRSMFLNSTPVSQGTPLTIWLETTILCAL